MAIWLCFPTLHTYDNPYGIRRDEDIFCIWFLVENKKNIKNISQIQSLSSNLSHFGRVYTHFPLGINWHLLDACLGKGLYVIRLIAYILYWKKLHETDVIILIIIFLNVISHSHITIRQQYWDT